MRTEGQYTLDADPIVLAKRVKSLELAVDMASGILVDMDRCLRRVVAACEAACEDRPTQAKSLREEYEQLQHIHDRAHAMGVLMGRSY